MNNTCSLLIFSLAAICCVLLTSLSNDALLDISLLTFSVIFVVITVSTVIERVEKKEQL